MSSLPDIVLAGPFQATDKEGLYWNVLNLSIAAESYLPDVRVQLDGPYEGALYDDPSIQQQVADKLREYGYTGPALDRAESGMQGKNYLMLEPNAAFKLFAATKGWQDLGTRDALAWGDYPAEPGPASLSRQEHTYVFRLEQLSGEPFSEDYKPYSECLNLFETTLGEKCRHLPGWSFVDHEDIECEAFELCQLEGNFEKKVAHVEGGDREGDGQGVGKGDRYAYLDLEVPIRRESAVLMTAAEVRVMAQGLQTIVDPVASARGLRATLHEVRYYRHYQQSKTGTVFRRG